MATIKRDISRDGKPVYRVRVKGHPTQSASFSRLAAAKLWGQRTGSCLHNTSYTVNDVISRCVREVLPHKAPHTTAYQGQQLRWWAERIGYQPLAALTPDHIAEQMAVLAKGPATMRRYLAVLGRGKSRKEVEAQVHALTGLNQEAKGLYRDENVFEDAHLQMAGYAAALRVLTRYAIIDGRDMAAEAIRPRVKGETTFVDGLIAFAVDTANQCLVPEGIAKPYWDGLSGAERFYLKLVDLEAKG
jgi:hypothetical protein